MHTAATRRAYLSSRASSRATRGSGPRGAGRAWRGGGRRDLLEILGGGHVPGGASRADASSYLSAQNALPQTLNALPQTAPINPTRRKGCVKLLASPKGDHSANQPCRRREVRPRDASDAPLLADYRAGIGD